MFSLNELTKVVAIYELPEIETPDDNVFGSLRFVIHVLRCPKGIYFPRVFRKELVEVTPVYCQKAVEKLLDKVTVEIVVRDDSCDWELFECVSENDAVERVLEKFNWLFTHGKGSEGVDQNNQEQAPNSHPHNNDN